MLGMCATAFSDRLIFDALCARAFNVGLSMPVFNIGDNRCSSKLFRVAIPTWSQYPLFGTP